MKNRTLIIIAIVAYALLFGLGAYASIDMNEKAITREIQRTIALIETDEELNKLKFCFKHELKDCSDDQIQSHNAKNPDAAFISKSFEQIVEEASDEARRLR